MKNKLFTTLVVLTVVFVCGNFSLAQESRELTESYSLDKDGHVLIDTYKGSIKIETWNKAKIDIHVKIEVDEWDSNAKDKVKDTEIRFRKSRNSLKIKTDYSNLKSRSLFGKLTKDVGNLPLVHYTIKMPATVELIIDDYKSETQISDMRSFIELETYKGTVDIRNLEGAIDLETYKGDIRVDFDKFEGRSSFETYKGEIDIKIPKNTNFDLNAHIGRKADFDCEFDLDRSYRRSRNKNRSFRESVNGGGHQLRLETDKGDIRLIAK